MLENFVSSIFIFGSYFAIIYFGSICMSIYDLTLNDLEEYLINNNEKKYRALQIFEWLYQKRVGSFDDMTNLGKELIEKLKNTFIINRLEIKKIEEDIDVNKYLFKLNDNESIESVLMRHNYGLSLCVSSQVGCNMGCSFCESGRLKKVRDLAPSEIILQIMMIEDMIKEKITHIVVMGIGEPFDNYNNIMKFVEIINHPKSLNIGARHITISTCGIVPKIKEFSDFPYQVNLAISLHAPNDELRTKLMPINKAYPLKELMGAVKEYIKKTNRRVTFEYILLDGINDSVVHAKELSSLIRGLNAYVNLIPYNESSNIVYNRSEKSQILLFYDIMKKEGINVTIRREFGSNISAACGQLRANKEE